MDVQRAAGLSDRLRDGGLRATAPRVEILAALEDLGGHRSAEEIHAELAARGSRVPRSSVYNVLTSLADAGLVLRADAGPGAVLYEAGGRWHHHFVCRVCGRVFDVECVTGEKPCLTPGSELGVVDEAQVIFRGTCTECLRASSVV